MQEPNCSICAGCGDYEPIEIGESLCDECRRKLDEGNVSWEGNNKGHIQR